MAKKWKSEMVEPLGTWSIPYEEANLLDRLKKKRVTDIIEVW